jgi:hypothetical protein
MRIALTLGMVLACGICVADEIPTVDEFFWGNWGFEGSVNGSPIKGKWSCRPAPGKHCTFVTGAILPKEKRGEVIQFAGVSGFNPAEQKIVSTEYWSNGDCLTVYWDDAPEGWKEITGTLVGIVDGGKIEGTTKLVRKGENAFGYLMKSGDDELAEIHFNKMEMPSKKAKAAGTPPAPKAARPPAPKAARPPAPASATPPPLPEG